MPKLRSIQLDEHALEGDDDDSDDSDDQLSNDEATTNWKNTLTMRSETESID